MKKSKLKSVVLLGISLGLVAGCQNAQGDEMSQEMRTFYEQLSPDAQQKFMQLDAKHRKMAMGIIKHDCKAASDCSGRREQAVEEQYRSQMQQNGRSQMNSKTRS